MYINIIFIIFSFVFFSVDAHQRFHIHEYTKQVKVDAFTSQITKFNGFDGGKSFSKKHRSSPYHLLCYLTVQTAPRIWLVATKDRGLG